MDLRGMFCHGDKIVEEHNKKIINEIKLVEGVMGKTVQNIIGS